MRVTVEVLKEKLSYFKKGDVPHVNIKMSLKEIFFQQ